MPIYEYRCQACGDEFEVIQKISEGPLKRCSKCGSRLEKLLSRTAFLLKGGGWYADGYGGSGSRKAGGAGEASSKDAPSQKSGSGSGEGGGNSKSSAAPSKPGGKPPSSS